MSNNLIDFVDAEYGVDLVGDDLPKGVSYRDIVRWADQCIVAKNNEIAALKNQLELAAKVYDEQNIGEK